MSLAKRLFPFSRVPSETFFSTGFAQGVSSETLEFIFAEGDVTCVLCFAFGACSRVQATRGDIQHCLWLYA